MLSLMVDIFSQRREPTEQSLIIRYMSADIQAIVIETVRFSTTRYKYIYLSSIHTEYSQKNFAFAIFKSLHNEVEYSHFVSIGLLKS